MADEYKLNEGIRQEETVSSEQKEANADSNIAEELGVQTAELTEDVCRSAEDQIAKLEYEDVYENELVEEIEKALLENEMQDETEEKFENEKCATEYEFAITEFTEEEQSEEPECEENEELTAEASEESESIENNNEDLSGQEESAAYENQNSDENEPADGEALKDEVPFDGKIQIASNNKNYIVLGGSLSGTINQPMYICGYFYPCAPGYPLMDPRFGMPGIGNNQYGENDGNVNVGANEPERISMAELYRRLTILHSEEQLLVAERENIRETQNDYGKNESIRALVEIVNLTKKIIRIVEEEIFACMDARDEKELNTHRKSIENYISEYNRDVISLEVISDTAFLEKIPLSAVEDLIAFRKRIRIPNVRYVGGRVENYYDDEADDGDRDLDFLDPDYNNETEREEQLRLLREELERERRRIEELYGYGVDERLRRKLAASLPERIKYAKSRAQRLMKARCKHRVRKLNAERDMLEKTFAIDERVIYRQVREISIGINRLKKLEKSAEKYEYKDNDLYYRPLLMNPAKIKTKYFSATDFEALRLKLEILLIQREELTERLLVLYGAEKQKSTRDTSDGVNAVRKRYANMIYKRQRKMAKKVSKLHMPKELRIKIYDLMNLKTELIATIEGLKYKLKKTKPKLQGAAKRDIKYEIKQTRDELFDVEDDLKYMLKRAYKYDKEYTMNVEWVAWIIGVLIVGGIGAFAYFFAGDLIANWFKGLF